MKESLNYECIIIGSGPGGYEAAIKASELGIKTAIIEKGELGGTCLNWGCVPTKALLQSAKMYSIAKKLNSYGIHAKDISFDFEKIISRSRLIVSRLSKGLNFLLKKHSIDIIKGKAEFLTSNSLIVRDKEGNKKTIFFKNAIIATGSSPKTFPFFNLDNKRVITSKELMTLKKLPERLLVVGAGVIGVEFSCLYASFGTKVTIIEALDSILPKEDREVSKTLKNILKRSYKIDIRTSTNVLSINATDSIVSTLIEEKGKQLNLESDIALISVGVVANTKNLGLEKIGVKKKKSFIEVDDSYRTNIKNIYAIGDVIGSSFLAHGAAKEGIIAAKNIAGQSKEKINYKLVPKIVYSKPQIASIGITEEEAKEKGLNFKTSKTPFVSNAMAVISSETEGFIKTILNKENNEILGIHIIHMNATELFAEALLISSLSIKAKDIINTIHPHPTLLEAVKDSFLELLK